MQVIRFSSIEKYKEWLKGKSYYVQQKAKEFANKFGENTTPVVIMVCEDTSSISLGCMSVSHIFINPEKFDEIMANAVIKNEDEGIDYITY